MLGHEYPFRTKSSIKWFWLPLGILSSWLCVGLLSAIDHDPAACTHVPHQPAHRIGGVPEGGRIERGSITSFHPLSTTTFRSADRQAQSFRGPSPVMIRVPPDARVLWNIFSRAARFTAKSHLTAAMSVAAAKQVMSFIVAYARDS